MSARQSMSHLMILRHAERPAIPDGEGGAELALTEAGRRAAYALGQGLGERPSAIRTSPVRRCVETAEEIARGADFDVAAITYSSVLGDPGVFVEDGDLAWDRWNLIGHEAVCREVVTAPEAAPGFRDPDAAVAMLQVEIEAALAIDDGMTIWITHDIILAAAAHRLCGAEALGPSWPAFLGCLWFQRDNSGWTEATWMPLGFHCRVDHGRNPCS